MIMVVSTFYFLPPRGMIHMTIAFLTQQ